MIERHSLQEGAPVQVHVRDVGWGRTQAAKFFQRLSGARVAAPNPTPNVNADDVAVREDKDKDKDNDTDTDSYSYVDDAGRVQRGATLAGAVMYTCVSGDKLQASNFREAVPGVAVGGGYVMGELGPAGPGGQGHLHVHTSMLGLFWDLPPLEGVGAVAAEEVKTKRKTKRRMRTEA